MQEISLEKCLFIKSVPQPLHTLKSSKKLKLKYSTSMFSTVKHAVSTYNIILVQFLYVFLTHNMLNVSKYFPWILILNKHRLSF